jgi:large subunit ribosomal protein L23
MKHGGSVIRRIQVTEKGALLSERDNQYLFEVAPWANKLDVKRAGEDLFKVSVTGVNTMRYAGKRKRERTARYGKRADWRRAVVTLKQGDRIDLA